MMYTKCPKCLRLFKVSAPILSKSNGLVRCGVCKSTFNAIRHLREETNFVQQLDTQVILDDEGYVSHHESLELTQPSIITKPAFKPEAPIQEPAPAPEIPPCPNHVETKIVTTNKGTIHVCENCAQTRLVPYSPPIELDQKKR